MVDWRKLFQPVADGSEKLKQLLVRVPVPPPTPTEEEFVSPLQAALKDTFITKDGIGYNRTCVNCSQHSGIDARMKDIIDTANDPEPWLKELHGELVATRDELAWTRTELAASKQYYTPQNRMKWAAYGAAASGSAGLILLLARFATEWAIANLPSYLPFLVFPLFGLL